MTELELFTGGFFFGVMIACWRLIFGALGKGGPRDL